MLRWAGRITTIFALCCAIGLHWVALQSLAWTTMLVEYSKYAPLRLAIAQTLDGAHPCSLCHAVAAGKSSEKKSDLQPATPQIDLICSTRPIRLLSSFIPFVYPTNDVLFSATGQPPPVPPPRPI